jgi:hypothetical protein
MNTLPTITLLLTTTLAVAGTDCIVSDDFGVSNGLWLDGANQTNNMRMQLADDRLHAYSPYGHYSSSPALAGAMSYGWAMDMTEDWAIQADLHIDPPSPAHGDVGMMFTVMLEGNPQTMSMTRAWTFGGGTYYDYISGQGYTYRSTTKWTNGQATTDQFGYGRAVEDRWYIWWDSSTGIMYGGDTLHATGTAFASSLNAFSTSSAAWVGLGGYAWGSVSAFNGSMWGDDICVLYGSAQGSLVGACCFGDTCEQVPLAACTGTFLGFGVACESCVCDSEPSCPGDFFEDYVVNVTDLNLLLTVWGTEACNYDLDGSGDVGMVDLLTVLQNWGLCSG